MLRVAAALALLLAALPLALCGSGPLPCRDVEGSGALALYPDGGAALEIRAVLWGCPSGSLRLALEGGNGTLRGALLVVSGNGSLALAFAVRSSNASLRCVEIRGEPARRALASIVAALNLFASCRRAANDSLSCELRDPRIVELLHHARLLELELRISNGSGELRAALGTDREGLLALASLYPDASRLLFLPPGRYELVIEDGELHLPSASTAHPYPRTPTPLPLHGVGNLIVLVALVGGAARLVIDILRARRRRSTERST